MSVLRSNRLREGGRNALLYFLSVFPHRSTSDKILQFLMRAQTQHLFAAAGRIPRAEIFVHDIEESCLNSNDARRERTATNSSVTRSGTRRRMHFLEKSHKAKMLSHLARNAADFCRRAIYPAAREVITGTPATAYRLALVTPKAKAKDPATWRGLPAGARGVSPCFCC